MNKIQFTIQNSHDCKINFLKGEVVATVPKLIKQQFKCPFLIIDESICQFHPDLLKNIKAPILTLKSGEDIKTFSIVEKIANFLQENFCRRDDSLLVIGGGSLGDVAGFAASIYKRGMEWFFFPTTLLSQVDSSIGGKVAINTLYGKNQLGAFWPPRQVYICPAFLYSLGLRQYNAGMAEIIKVAPFAKGKLLSILQEASSPEIQTLIELAVQAKLDIIGNDWFEARGGTRIALNFGHTIGHGLEKTVPNLLHGEAVALGMLSELYLARSIGEETFCCEIIKELLQRFGLPTEFLQLLSRVQPQKFLNVLIQDKKNVDDNLVFIIPGVDGTIKRFILNIDQLKRILF